VRTSHALRCRRLVRVSALALLALFPILAAPASAQYFGRNKVVYGHFDWRIEHTEHFDIHYYPQEEPSIRDVGRMAERWYERLSSVFGTKLSRRTPIILYANQSDFQQTTVTPELISEGTGGFTEPLRDRVVLPLTADGEDNDHVIGHELVHVFQFDLLNKMRNRGRRYPGSAPVEPRVPLWMIEGLAEYLSLGRDSALTAMWLRDALMRDALPDLTKLSRDYRYFPYRWGQAFWAYVGGRWDDRTVISLYVRSTVVGVDAALKEVVGLSPKDFSRDWRAAIGAAYGRFLEARHGGEGLGNRLIPQHGKTLDANIGPALSPDGTQVIFLSSRGLFSFDLYLADARTGEIRSKILSTDSDAHFDALRFVDSAGSWSPDGSKFALIVYTRGANKIAIVDIASRRIEREIGVPGVGAMWDPAWSPDGRSIAFSGSAGAVSDLYLLDLATEKARKLTDDPYADLQAAWSPDGKTIAFVSDRGPGTNLAELTFGPVRVWLLDLAGGPPRPATPPGKGNQINPQFSPDGQQLYFLSDASGVSDLYRLEIGGGRLFQVTRAATGVAGITRLSPALTVAARSGRAMFSVFANTEYEIHDLEPAQLQGEPVPAEAPGAAVAENAPSQLPPVRLAAGQSQVSAYLANPAGLPKDESMKETGYRPRLQLEAVSQGAGVAYSSFGYVVGGDVSALFSDMLNQYLLGVSIQGGSSVFHDYGGSAFFLDQKGRFQWGVGAGHVPYLSGFSSITTVPVDAGNGQTVPGTAFDQIFEKITQDQVQLLGQYPFSPTRRVEATVSWNRLSFSTQVFRDVFVGNQFVGSSRFNVASLPSLTLYQGSLALVGDNSAFGFTSPARGQRYRLEVGATAGDLKFETVTADYRRYFFLRPVTLAMRGLHLGRYGGDSESNLLAPLYLGDPWLVRGYDFGSLGGANCTAVPGSPNACPEFDRLIGSRLAVANFEVRLPVFGSQNYGLVELPFLPTELSAFVDAGAAWSAHNSVKVRFARNTIERVPVVSAGLSARLLLGGFAVLEFYVAKPFERPQKSTVTGFLISPGW
jgi:hypothetical protein